jgi:RNA polymerase sigma-B factor
MSLDNTVSNYVNFPVTWADLLPCHHSIALQQQQEEKEQLEGEISMLDDKPRMAVELVFFKQLTRKDAAKKIGVLNGYTNDSNTISAKRFATVDYLFTTNLHCDWILKYWQKYGDLWFLAFWHFFDLLHCYCGYANVFVR